MKRSVQLVRRDSFHHFLPIHLNLIWSAYIHFAIHLFPFLSFTLTTSVSLSLSFSVTRSLHWRVIPHFCPFPLCVAAIFSLLSFYFFSLSRISFVLKLFVALLSPMTIRVFFCCLYLVVPYR